MNAQEKKRVSTSWRIDETYIKVADKDRYLKEPLTEIISGIKTSKLGGINTLIIVLNATTETLREGLLLILGLKNLNPPKGQIRN